MGFGLDKNEGGMNGRDGLGAEIGEGEISERSMRTVRGEGAHRTSSSGWEQGEQCPGEFGNALPLMPHTTTLGNGESGLETSRDMSGLRETSEKESSLRNPQQPDAPTRKPISAEDQEGESVDCDFGWWKAEPNVGRVAVGVKKRVSRLKGLGNGQVALQAALAWTLLKG
jgi:hypothetical protein